MRSENELVRTFEDIDVDVASSLGASVHGGVAEAVLHTCLEIMRIPYNIFLTCLGTFFLKKIARETSLSLHFHYNNCDEHTHACINWNGTEMFCEGGASPLCAGS